MLNQPLIEKLHILRLRVMADAFREQQETSTNGDLCFEERFALLVDRQWNWRQNRALDRRLRNARLQGPACLEDIDYRTARGLDRQLVRSLSNDSDWVRRHQHLLVTGPAGVGKTILA
jgi:DNA replication protein DnaC